MLGSYLNSSDEKRQMLSPNSELELVRKQEMFCITFLQAKELNVICY